MATLAQHTKARNDVDLQARFVAAAEQAGVPQAANWAGQYAGELVAADIGETTVADVHAYAVATHEPTPAPGADDTKITDAQIEAAVAAVRAEQTPPTA